MIDSISFCVINWEGKEEDTLRCVESIRRQRLENKEMILFGATVKMDGVRVLDCGDRPASSTLNAIRNFLVESSSKDYVAFLDTAVEIKDDWYENLKQFDCFDVTGSRLVSPAGNHVVDWAYRFSLGERKLALPLRYDEWTTKAYVSGALMVVRRTIFDRIVFDESMPLNGDSDFCARASDIGYRIGVNPKAVAIYHGTKMHDADGKSFTFDESQRIVREYRKNLAEGNKAFAMNNYDAAITFFGKIANDVSPEASILGTLGWALYFKGRYDEAIIVLEKCVGANPHNDYCLRGLGWAKLQVGRHEESIRHLTRALKIVNPDDREAWIETARGLGWSYYHKSGYKEAVSIFTAALEKLSPDEKGALNDVYNGLGWAHLNRKEFDEASKYFTLLLKSMDPANKEEIRLAKRGLDAAKHKTAACDISALPHRTKLISRKISSIRKIVSKIKSTLK